MGLTESREQKWGRVTGFYTIHEGKIISNLALVGDDGEIIGGYEHMNSYLKPYQNFDHQECHVAKLVHKKSKTGEINLYMDGPDYDGNKFYSQTKPRLNYYLELHEEISC